MSPFAKIDARACAGHADCAHVAPQAFAIGADDVAIAIGSAPLELMVEAAEACPSVAISIVDSDTGDQLYP